MCGLVVSKDFETAKKAVLIYSETSDHLKPGATAMIFSILVV
jgi:hypothetical protein